MKILVLSDIHDHIWHLKTVLTSDPARETKALICCGDLCAPFVIPILGSYQQGPVHIVFGNNDADTYRMTSIATTSFEDKIHLHGEYATLEMHGQTIAVNHFHNIAADLAESGKYDWVFYGHNHLAAHQLLGTEQASTELLNPGTLMGMALGAEGPYRVAASFATVDLANREVAWYHVLPEPDRVESWDLS